VRGRVQKAGARLRCRNGAKRSLKGYLAPFCADMGSRSSSPTWWAGSPVCGPAARSPDKVPLDTRCFRTKNVAMTELVTAATAGALRAALADLPDDLQDDLPDDLPGLRAGEGFLDAIQRGEARVDIARRGGLVDDGEANARPADVLWLLGGPRDD
jgi:hypothetical protein